MERFIWTVIVIPYFILIHIVIAVWSLIIIRAAINRNFSVKISTVKMVMLFYGTIFGFLLPYLEYIYGKDETYWFFLGDIPAAAVSSFIMQLQTVSPSSLWPHHWEYFMPYIFFGAIGGWGLGQSLDWVKSVIMTRKRRNDIAS